jgi:tripartite-type tricarboxylate transporter receptor subunit TctC
VTTVKRLPALPSLPTLDESGLPGYDSANWNGLLAPAGVPKTIIVRLNAAIGTVVDAPDMTESLNKQGMMPQPLTPEQFGAFVHAEIVKNAKLIKLIKAKNE